MAEFDNIELDDPDFIEKRNNRKLTADKIRQILSKVQNNPSDSAKRWVWELMQNAKDVPNKFGRVSVKIILNSNNLQFKHNGDPFTLKNIFSLIQQVSSKDSANNDEEVTGKFGTGFISTHLLSEKIEVSGIVLHKGTYRRFRSCLDRSGRTSEEMLPKIDAALEHVRDIQNDTLFPRENYYEIKRVETSYDTVFSYNLSSFEKQKAAILGLEDLINTLPVTLVNIPKIKSIEVVNNLRGTNVVFQSDLIFEDDCIKKISVSVVNSIGQKEFRNFITYFKPDLALSIEVSSFENLILKEINQDAPKLFRDFPLIGSSKFYYPFVLNGFKFNPTEDRDGILLHGVENFEAEENRKIISKAFEASKEFTEWIVKQNASNRYVCALSRLPDEKWQEQSKNWYASLQQNYRAFLLSQPLVETDEGNMILKDSLIPTYGSSKETKLRFYNITKNFIGKGMVPREDIILNWIDYTGPKEEIDSWNYEIRYNLDRFLSDLQGIETVENLKNKLPENLNVYQWLNSLYEFLNEERETERFTEFKIIPNQKNVFQTLSDLYQEDKESPIAEEFLDTLDALEIFWRQELINRNIKLPLLSVKKRDLNDASERINETLKNYPNNDKLLKLAIDLIRNEGQYTTGVSFKANLFKIANELFKLNTNFRTVEKIKGFNFDVAVEKVIRIINEKIAALVNLKELAKNVDKDYDSTVIWYNTYLELLEGSDTFKINLEYQNIVPNRKGDFCSYKGLYAFGTEETPLNEKLINILYDLNKAEDWHSTLIHDGFSIKLEPRKYEELGGKIDESLVNLLKEESFSPGSIKPYKNTILDLINWVKTNSNTAEKYLNKTFLAANDLWVKFSMTNEIMNLLSDEYSMAFLQEISVSNISLAEVKELVSIAQELDNLGLSGMSEILDHAKELLEIEKDFQYLKDTGENIEVIFKEALALEGINIGINHIGIGSHDFELFNLIDRNKKVFVEIKSFIFGSKKPFKFASSQIRKSIEVPEKYFVCMLERPLNGEPASVLYLKEKLFYKSNLNVIVESVIKDIDAFERIEDKKDDVKLVLPLRDKPRIHIKHDLLSNNSSSFDDLIIEIKLQLL